MTAVTEDGVAVLTLLSAFARMADEGTLDELGALFAEDGAWSMPGVTWTGRDEVVAGLGSMRDLGHAGPGSGSWHLVTNPEVLVDGDRAAARSCWQLVGSADGQVRALGRYRDELRRGADGTWLLTRREVTAG